MVSLFGRGFDSLQLHKIRSSVGRPYFVELKGVGDLFLFCFAKALPLVAWRPSGSAVSLQAFARTNTLEPAWKGWRGAKGTVLSVASLCESVSFGAERYLCPFVPLLCPKYIVYLWL